MTYNYVIITGLCDGGHPSWVRSRLAAFRDRLGICLFKYIYIYTYICLNIRLVGPSMSILTSLISPLSFYIRRKSWSMSTKWRTLAADSPENKNPDHSSFRAFTITAGIWAGLRWSRQYVNLKMCFKPSRRERSAPNICGPTPTGWLAWLNETR